MRETKNLRVVDTTLLKSPNQLTRELPLSTRAAETVYRARGQIEELMSGGRRKLVIVGPCSIHDPDAAIEYASRLQQLSMALSDQLLVVMRVYFEKPRTTVGWKGLINDPHIDGTYDIPNGITRARALLVELAELGMPAATEMLDPIMPQYLADLVAWGAIGARTTESQTHREMASGLSMPIGFKNGTDGNLGVAVNAMITASRSHSFLGIDGDGRVGVVRTRGNPFTHLVLRGGNTGPNYRAADVEAAAAILGKSRVCEKVLIDCSHDNSAKNHDNQPAVLSDVGDQIREGSSHVLGVMVESNLVAGRQDLPGDRSQLTYGQSITDACVDFATTERMLAGFAEAVAQGKPARAIA